MQSKSLDQKIQLWNQNFRMFTVCFFSSTLWFSIKPSMNHPSHRNPSSLTSKMRPWLPCPRYDQRSPGGISWWRMEKPWKNGWKRCGLPCGYENCHLPIKNAGFSVATLVYQRVSGSFCQTMFNNFSNTCSKKG